MPILVTDETAFPPAQVPPRKRWTRAECAPLEASGLFEQERLELVCGELISKMGKNRPHANAFRRTLLWLLKVFGGEFVDPEVTIDVSPEDNPTSEPQPDMIVLNKECGTFVSGNPQPPDISLLVEIADSSLELDRTVKAALYARAGIVEYWVVDVANRRLIAHREPLGGVYRWIAVYGEHESIAPLAAPTAEFCPAIAFGG